MPPKKKSQRGKRGRDDEENTKPKDMETMARFNKLLRESDAVDWVGTYTKVHSSGKAEQSTVEMGFLKKEAMALTVLLSFYQGAPVTATASAGVAPAEEGDVVPARSQTADEGHTEGDGAPPPQLTKAKSYMYTEGPLCPVALVSGPGGLARKLAIYYDESDGSEQRSSSRWGRCCWGGEKLDLSIGYNMSCRSMLQLAQLGFSDWFLGTLNERLEMAEKRKNHKYLPITVGGKLDMRNRKKVHSIAGSKTSGSRNGGNKTLLDDCDEFINNSVRMGQVDIVALILRFIQLGNVEALIKLAIETEHLPMAELLIREGHGGQPLSEDTLGRMLAVSAQCAFEEAEGGNVNTDFLDYFLELGADPNRVVAMNGGGDNLTRVYHYETFCPLAWAANEHKLNAVRYLVNKGAKFTFMEDLAVGGTGTGVPPLQTLLLFAGRSGRLEDLKWLYSLGDEKCNIAIKDKSEVQKVFVKVVTRCKKQESVLVPLLEYLIDMGADIDRVSAGDWGMRMPLFEAAASGNFITAKFIIEKGAELKDASQAFVFLFEKTFLKGDLEMTQYFAEKMKSCPECHEGVRKDPHPKSLLWKATGTSTDQYYHSTNAMKEITPEVQREFVRFCVKDLGAKSYLEEEGGSYRRTKRVCFSPLWNMMIRQDKVTIKLLIDAGAEGWTSPSCCPHMNGGKDVTVIQFVLMESLEVPLRLYLEEYLKIPLEDLDAQKKAIEDLVNSLPDKFRVDSIPKWLQSIGLLDEKTVFTAPKLTEEHDFIDTLKFDDVYDDVVQIKGKRGSTTFHVKDKIQKAFGDATSWNAEAKGWDVKLEGICAAYVKTILNHVLYGLEPPTLESLMKADEEKKDEEI